MRNFDLLRMSVVGAAVLAALGSATSTSQPGQTGYYPRPAQAAVDPQPSPESPPPPAPGEGHAPATAPARVAGTCDAFCSEVARCNLAPFSDCVTECRQSGTEQQPNGPAQLTTLAQSSCAQLSAWAESPPPAAHAPEQVAASSQPASQPAFQQPSPPPKQPSSAAKSADKPAEKPAEKPSSKPADKPSDKPADKPAYSAKRTQWVCNATGSWQRCEAQGYMCFPQTSMALGFGPTEPLARASATSQCSTAMTRLMSANFAYRTSITAPCHVMSCSPPNAP
jgi:hypothetical protein